MSFFRADRFSLVRRTLVAALALAPLVAHADYPDRPITMVVPYAPGGAADAVARLMAQKLGPKLNNATIVIDNRPGASGTIGAGSVARAAADGYTVLYDATPFSINPHLFPRLPYDVSALQPVSLLLTIPQLVIVNHDAPYKTLNDLTAKAKAEPGKINYASGGSGTVQRLAAELLRQKLQLDMVHVPYKSGGPAIAGVMGGQVDMMFASVTASNSLITSNKLRALAVSSPERSPLMPNVPTLIESGVPGFDASEWNGIFVPAKTPKEITDKLQKAVVDVIKDPEVQQRLRELGAQPIGSSADEFATFLKQDSAKWGDVVRTGNIKAD
ncbi:tripartite tricarboxylate transporter substrate binding protein [Pigmentiphaga aceris]|uniref:Tripartite tricarboxylate transporter substrate binding protein n=1 Tax=Pigmentiphaga aceris TaxID=1940612 RepID=A0A5C0AR17_9BURK|nr:tripartite tricarboxylate transporter substrate binding protein [Pigmentiphaga aceris]QEI04498.1 tripartite tricarboxylate transporter substrate binding protein [Pigmentiphaga aceris]